MLANRMMMGSAGKLPVEITNTDSPVSGSDLTTYTFSGAAIGVASSARTVVVIASGISTTTVIRTVSTITVGGISAALVKRINVASSGNYPFLEIWQATVPTGTTADIVVTLSAGAARCGLGVFDMQNADSAAFDTGSSIANPLNDVLTIPAQGGAISGAFADGSATFSWTNLTERYDESVEGPSSHTGASDVFSTLQTDRSITATPSAGTYRIMALASWGPA